LCPAGRHFGKLNDHRVNRSGAGLNAKHFTLPGEE